MSTTSSTNQQQVEENKSSTTHISFVKNKGRKLPSEILAEEEAKSKAQQQAKIDAQKEKERREKAAAEAAAASAPQPIFVIKITHPCSTSSDSLDGDDEEYQFFQENNKTGSWNRQKTVGWMGVGGFCHSGTCRCDFTWKGSLGADGGKLQIEVTRKKETFVKTDPEEVLGGFVPSFTTPQCFDFEQYKTNNENRNENMLKLLKEDLAS